MNNLSQVYSRLYNDSFRILELVFKYQQCKIFYNAVPSVIVSLILIVGLTQTLYPILHFADMFKYIWTIILLLLTFWAFWIKSYVMKKMVYEEAIKKLNDVLSSLENTYRELGQMSNNNKFDWFYEEIESLKMNEREEFNLPSFPLRIKVNEKIRSNSRHHWIHDCLEKKEYWNIF